MLLLTYNLGEHVNQEEYEQWLRDVDNPFFNSVPGVKRYANWKVLDEKLGTVQFTHYDLLEMTIWMPGKRFGGMRNSRNLPKAGRSAGLYTVLMKNTPV